MERYIVCTGFCSRRRKGSEIREGMVHDPGKQSHRVKIRTKR